ncbi:pyridoxamine 5'-phosphate oxidase family protein [Halomicroarcula sp. GCM10025817]|uniref:pyridoxamine 5'-phosphate oxidase family protein n=1 Tax=Haloarcula TaxID=2237 RepID=UPI0023E79EDC|nr:pyridoxamine 5'-phosphate oxidase family protein [Halomicroarcula sp. SYNS111]
MDPDVEFAYTAGMDASTVEERLAERQHGVLSLADGDEAYAFPVFHHYEDGSLYFRLGVDSSSEKAPFLDATATATYVVYATEPTDDPEETTGWSVVARGPIHEVPRDDPAHEAVEINERYAPIRIFDEPLDDVDVRLYELEVEALTGRRN